MSGARRVTAFPVGSPGIRPCCLLTPDGPIFTDSSPRTHRFGGKDRVGVIYTCKGGFLDLGHLRDLADLTLFYYRQIDRVKGTSGARLNSLSYGSNVIQLTTSVSPSEYIAVAQAVAYAESIAHEIETYWRLEPGSLVPEEAAIGGHNSAFSPEDIVSNFLGTFIGGRAIESLKAGTVPAFDEAAENELGTLLADLGGTGGTVARTLDAYSKVDGVWIARPAPGRAYYYVELLRRNFGTTPDATAFEPWLVSGVAGCIDTAWPAVIPQAVSATGNSAFTAAYEIPWILRTSFEPMRTNLGTKLDKADFATRITAIKTHARKQYGPLFDKPDPYP
jgi:hypothetical protein